MPNNPIRQIAKQLVVSEFDRNSQATVSLAGEPIGTLTRTPRFIYAETLGVPWGGGRNLRTAVQAVANAYSQMHK